MLDTEDAKRRKHGPRKWVKQGPGSEKAFREQWRKKGNASFLKVTISPGNCKSSGCADTAWTQERVWWEQRVSWGQVACHHVFEDLSREVIGSDLHSALTTDSVENRLEERSLELRTERRQLRALRKAAGGREASLRGGKEAEWQTWCLHAGGDWRRKNEEGRPLETGNTKRQLSGGTEAQLSSRRDKWRCLRKPGRHVLHASDAKSVLH